MAKYQTKKMKVQAPSVFSMLLGLIVDPYNTANRLVLAQDRLLFLSYSLCISTFLAVWFFAPILILQSSGISVSDQKVISVSIVLMTFLFTSYFTNLIIFFFFGTRVGLLKMLTFICLAAFPIVFFLSACSIYDYVLYKTFSLHLNLFTGTFSSVGGIMKLVIGIVLLQAGSAMAGSIAAEFDYPVLISFIFALFSFVIFYSCFFLVVNLFSDLLPTYPLGLQSLVPRIQIAPMLGIA